MIVVSYPVQAWVPNDVRRRFAPNALFDKARQSWLLSPGELAAFRRGMGFELGSWPIDVDGVCEMMGRRSEPRPVPVHEPVDENVSINRARRLREELRRERELEMVS